MKSLPTPKELFNTPYFSMGLKASAAEPRTYLNTDGSTFTLNPGDYAKLKFMGKWEIVKQWRQQ